MLHHTCFRHVERERLVLPFHFDISTYKIELRGYSDVARNVGTIVHFILIPVVWWRNLVDSTDGSSRCRSKGDDRNHPCPFAPPGDAQRRLILI